VFPFVSFFARCLSLSLFSPGVCLCLFFRLVFTFVFLIYDFFLSHLDIKCLSRYTRLQCQSFESTAFPLTSGVINLLFVNKR
jgi:hypothetical protein